MAAIYKGDPKTNTGNYYGGGGESAGGHVIQDNGVEMIEREALNLVGLDVDDDAINGSTNVAAHRLTSDEMSEIMSNPPVNPTSMPILFDERDSERVVGWYVFSDGTKKPVYQKDYITSLPSGSGYETLDSSINRTNVTFVKAFVPTKYVGTSDDSWDQQLLQEAGQVVLYAGITNIGVQISYGRLSTGVVIHVSIQYTKNSDTPV